VNILFLGAGKRYSLFERFYKAAREEDIPLSLYTYELMPYVHVSPISTVLEGVRFDSPDFIDDLKFIVESYEIQMIIPCMDSATVALSKLGLPQAIVSDIALCEIFNDKKATTAWFKRHGIKTPAIEPHIFLNQKTIVKDRFGYGSRNQIVVDNYTDYEVNKSKLTPGDYIFQQFIEGPEFTIDAYVDREGQYYISSRKRLLVSRGEVENSVTAFEPDLHVACQKILSIPGFRGPITLQAIKKDEEFWFIEINPRFGGGCILSIEAGMDTPRWLLREYIGKPIEPTLIKENLLMLRSSRETFHENYPRTFTKTNI
jgi:carbamoyl-phosphate synthase large subunit